MQYFTYRDYLKWDDSVRCELIYGESRAMVTPSPSHQQILGNLQYALRTLLRGKTCRALASPLDVRLNHTAEDDIVVQPDIVIICDLGKIGAKSIIGAPEMVIEILSESTAKHDRITKLQLYKDAGVLEYWIVDPVQRTVAVYALPSDSRTTYADGVIPVGVVAGGAVDFDDVFEDV